MAAFQRCPLIEVPCKWIVAWVIGSVVKCEESWQLVQYSQNKYGAMKMEENLRTPSLSPSKDPIMGSMVPVPSPHLCCCHF